METSWHGVERSCVLASVIPVLLLLSSSTSTLHPPAPQSQPGGSAADSAAVASAVARFHQHLAAGDTAGVLRLLAPDALIFEGGTVETRDHYRSHHLGADIQFLQAVKANHEVSRVVVRGDVAWVGGTSMSRGTFRGRVLQLAGAELVVLERRGDQWYITAVHWSSQERKAS